MLVAPDKFKGSLSGAEVARAIASGIQHERPNTEVEVLPIADGGEGSLDLFLSCGFDRIEAVVSGPTGQPVHTAYARNGQDAFLEMADACGLMRLPLGRPVGLAASSRGLGELLLQALDDGCRNIVLGVGGSASTDGGSGMLSALGARLTDGTGTQLPDGGYGLKDLAGADLTQLHPRLAEANLVVACDVSNPLTGADGSAAVYGPQKGLTTADIWVLDQILDRWADLIADTTGNDLRNHPGAGAAGGVGFAAAAVLGATVNSGASWILDLLDFSTRLTGADLVIVGEGSLDKQSLRGKAPIAVARRAARHDVPVVAVCGRRELDEEALAAAGIGDCYALLDIEPDMERCIEDAARLLQAVGKRIASEHFN